MKTAIVIFTKVPKEGETKTRLTVERGGIFTPREAKDFYEASLLDVIDSCIAARSGELYICHNSSGDQEYLRRLLQVTSDPQAVRQIFRDQGGTFDQGMQYAFDYIFQDRSEEQAFEGAIIVGGDNPCLQPATIREAVRKLEGLAASKEAAACVKKYGNPNQATVGAALIESIDQEGGFNLIGYTYSTPFNFNGVFYNQDGITALDMIALKAAEKGIPIGLVEMVTDVDLPVDIASLMPVLNTLRLAEKFDPSVMAPKRTIKFMQDFGFHTVATPERYEAGRS